MPETNEKYTKNTFIAQITSGVLSNNPVLVQLLGLCTALLVTTTVSGALGIGLAVTAVLICSNVLVSLLAKFIPKKLQIVLYIVIIAALVTAVQLIFKSFFPDLNKSLGILIPLIAANSLILSRAVNVAEKKPLLFSLIDGLSMGVGYTLALLIVSAIRELFGAGTLCGINIMPSSYEPVTFLLLPSGALILFGFMLALTRKLIELQQIIARKLEEKRMEKSAEAQTMTDEAPAEPAAEATVEIEDASDEKNQEVDEPESTDNDLKEEE